MGIGRAITNITFVNTADFTQEDIQTFNISQSLGTAKEFLGKVNDYKYFKIKKITVTIFPNTNQNNYQTVLYVSWDTEYPEDYTDLSLSDSAKVVCNNSVKLQCFTFIPPKFQNEDGFNPRQWQSINNKDKLMLLLTLGQRGGNCNFRVDLLVLFAGNRIAADTTKKKAELIKIERKKEEKKEKIKDDGNIKDEEEEYKIKKFLFPNIEELEKEYLKEKDKKKKKEFN